MEKRPVPKKTYLILKLYKIDIIPNSKIAQNKYGKIINMYDLNDNYLRTFPSTTEAAKFMVENKKRL